MIDKNNIFKAPPAWAYENSYISSVQKDLKNWPILSFYSV